MNDSFFLLESYLYNFADDNTISVASETIPELVDSLTTKLNVAIDWFNSNSMIVSPYQFKSIVLKSLDRKPLEYKSASKITALPHSRTADCPKLTADCPQIVTFDKISLSTSYEISEFLHYQTNSFFI